MVEAVGAPIVEYFAALKDPRIDRSKRHNLLDIVTIAICGTICGADNWVDIELFGKCKEEGSSGPHHQDSGEAKIRESTAGVSRKPSSDGKARGSSSKHLWGLTAWNT